MLSCCLTGTILPVQAFAAEPCETAARAEDAVGSTRITLKSEVLNSYAKPYLDTLEQAKKEYGEAKLVTDARFPNSQQWRGLLFAKLVDFDGDNIPELYYVVDDGSVLGVRAPRSTPQQKLLTYQDGNIIDLKIPGNVNFYEPSPDPNISLWVGTDKAYLENEEMIKSSPADAYGKAGTVCYTKKGSEMIPVMTYIVSESDTTPPIVDGETVTNEEWEAALNELRSGMTLNFYSFYDSYDPDSTVGQTIEELNKKISSTKRGTHTISERYNPKYTNETVTRRASQNYRTRTQVTAAPSKHKVYVDGAEAKVAAYTIDGNNYFKLRDIATVLNGTSKQFDVGWDNTNKAISLISNHAYTPVGGELETISSQAVTAAVSTAKVYKDGNPMGYSGYIIDGNNYYKLRDVLESFGVDITWDAENQRMDISTGGA